MRDYVDVCVKDASKYRANRITFDSDSDADDVADATDDVSLTEPANDRPSDKQVVCVFISVHFTSLKQTCQTGFAA